MKQVETLSKKNKIIMYILIAISVVAVIIVTIFNIIQSIKNVQDPYTDQDLIAEYTWYDSNGHSYWDFSSGHKIFVYLRDTPESEFEYGAQIVYVINEDFKQIQISSDTTFTDSAIYDYEISGNYLLLYNIKYQEEGKKPLPTLIFSRHDEFK